MELGPLSTSELFSQSFLRHSFSPGFIIPWYLRLLPSNHSISVIFQSLYVSNSTDLMFIGPCIIAIVDEWKTNFMSLAILFHLLCAQHVSDINISIFRCLRLCWWITTSVVLFSVHCVLELLVWLVFGGVRFAGWSATLLCFSLQNEHHQGPRAGLDRCRKSRPHRDSIPGPSIP